MAQDSDGQLLFVFQRLVLTQIRHAILGIPLNGVVRSDYDFKLGRAAVGTNCGGQPALLLGGTFFLFLEQAQDDFFSYQAQPVFPFPRPGMSVGELAENRQLQARKTRTSQFLVSWRENQIIP